MGLNSSSSRVLQRVGGGERGTNRSFVNKENSALVGSGGNKSRLGGGSSDGHPIKRFIGPFMVHRLFDWNRLRVRSRTTTLRIHILIRLFILAKTERNLVHTCVLST